LNFVADPEAIIRQLRKDNRQEEQRSRGTQNALNTTSSTLSALSATPLTLSPILPTVPEEMNNPWEFPALKKVETIKEFNGNADSLDDFMTSVNAYIFFRDLPLKQGGWVQPDDEDGWEYCPPPVNDAAAGRMRKNYKYGKKFCVMLAERFTDAAREWWITSGKNSGVNC